MGGHCEHLEYNAEECQWRGAARRGAATATQRGFDSIRREFTRWNAQLCARKHALQVEVLYMYIAACPNKQAIKTGNKYKMCNFYENENKQPLKSTSILVLLGSTSHARVEEEYANHNAGRLCTVLYCEHTVVEEVAVADLLHEVQLRGRVDHLCAHGHWE